jgi:hypothetical protein
VGAASFHAYERIDRQTDGHNWTNSRFCQFCERAVWNKIFNMKCNYVQGLLKKDRNFTIKTLFYNIFSTVSFKVDPSTGNISFPMFLPLLERFLERTFCDGAQFSYRIFLNLRVFKKRPNFLNSSPTSREGVLQLQSALSGRFWQQTAICPGLIRRTACARAQFCGCSSTSNAHSETGKMAVCCQNLPLGALSSRSASSVLVGELFKKFCLFRNTGVFCEVIKSYRNLCCVQH